MRRRARRRIRKIPSFRELIGQVLSDFRKRTKPGRWHGFQDHFVPAPGNQHFSAFKPESLGQPDRLAAAMPE